MKIKGRTWSRDTNSCLPFGVNLNLNLSNIANRPFPHYAPVSKHKDMRTRLGWTISYKSLYFVHPSLELVPLFKGMRERSIKSSFNVTQILLQAVQGP